MAGLQPSGRQDSGSIRDLKLTCMNNLLATPQERVYFKDLMSRFLFVSAGWIAAYTPGRTAEQLTGKTDFDIFSYDHAAAALRDEQLIIRTGRAIVGKVERETYRGRADAWVSTTKMPLKDDRNRIIGTFGITRDVTAQIKAENALKEVTPPPRTITPPSRMVTPPSRTASPPPRPASPPPRYPTPRRAGG